MRAQRACRLTHVVGGGARAYPETDDEPGFPAVPTVSVCTLAVGRPDANMELQVTYEKEPQPEPAYIQYVSEYWSGTRAVRHVETIRV